MRPAAEEVMQHLVSHEVAHTDNIARQHDGVIVKPEAAHGVALPAEAQDIGHLKPPDAIVRTLQPGALLTSAHQMS